MEVQAKKSKEGGLSGSKEGVEENVIMEGSEGRVAEHFII